MSGHSQEMNYSFAGNDNSKHGALTMKKTMKSDSIWVELFDIWDELSNAEKCFMFAITHNQELRQKALQILNDAGAQKLVEFIKSDQWRS